MNSFRDNLMQIALMGVLFFSCEMLSQTKFENITLKDGLPSNRINDCAKDYFGFIWFATDAGICRYDGIRSTVFTSEANIGLTEDTFQHLYVKSKDEILFLSYSGQLYCYQYSKGCFVNYSIQKKELKNKSLTSIYKDRNNWFWFSTSNGMIKTDSDISLIKEYLLKDEDKNPTVTNAIISICEDNNGKLWLGMLSRAIFMFDPKSETFSNKGLKNIVPLHQQVNEFISFPDSNFIFAATGGEGLLKININNFSVKKWKWNKDNLNTLPSDRISTLAAQGDSILWIGTIDGLASLNLKNGIIKRYLNKVQDPYSITSNVIQDLFIDSQNILWVSTFGGIAKLVLSPDRFTKVSHDPLNKNSVSSNKVVHCIKDKYGNLWVATSQGIDVRAANSGNHFHYKLPKSFPHHTNEEIIKFFIDDNEMWWVGTWGGGISRFRLPNNFEPGDNLYFENFYHIMSDPTSISSNFIRSIVKDSYGNIWISTWNGGLNKINSIDKRKKIIQFQRFTKGDDPSKSVASNFIESLLFDSEGYLWLGTSHGIQRMNTHTNQFKMFYTDRANPNSLINMSLSLLLDKMNNIWICNFVGIVKITKDSTGKYISEIMQTNKKSGYFSLAIDNYGVLWFSTQHSQIGSFNPETGKSILYSMIEEVDGFDFYLGEATVDKNDDIYFIGASGYLFFNSRTLSQNKYIPPVFITSIQVNDEEYFADIDISQLKKIELDYDQRNISIGFAALNYIHPEENKYKYLLEGQNRHWITSPSGNGISFTNLQAGDYRLKIIGSNNDGLWNDKEASLLIVIKPPFWQNLYYRIVLVSLIILAIFVFFNSKIRRLNTERHKQLQFSKLLIESQEDERKRLSNELHDSLGQNLLVIKNQIDFYVSSEKKNESELIEISELIKESISEVKEISSNLHPHQLERLGLNKAINAMVKKITTYSKLEIEVDLKDVSNLFSREAEINIYRIIQESLNNVIKHSYSTKVSIEILKENELVLLKVEDNGKGFDINDADMETKLSEGLGLKSIQERVRLLCGELKIESSRGIGTKIIIKIPVNR